MDEHRDPLLPLLEGGHERATFVVPRVAAAPRAPVTGLLAGAAEVDITPPPGLPKAGFSRNAHDGTGFRTRLRARILHLRSGTSSLALVALDLLSGSSVVLHLVARRIATETDVPIEALFLGATHTHAAPGQFNGSAFYTRFASNRPGFDPAWTHFLVERIAEGIIEAVRTRRPARLAVGTTEVWGFTRNRSLAARVRNETVTDRRMAPQRKFLEIDPDLHLIRVDAAAPDGGHEPLAAFVIFGIHGTGVSQRVHEYHADVWADLVGSLVDRIEASTGLRPVVGAVEGAHGDIAPALLPGGSGFVECRRIGTGIATAAASLYGGLEASLTEDVELAAGLRELDVVGADRTIDGIELAPAALGAAMVAGALENVTPVVHRIPPFRAGSVRPFAARAPHGRKVVLGGVLQRRLLPADEFPRFLPLQVIRLGSMVLVGLPFELTAEAGRRIREHVAEAGHEYGIDHVVASSVANEYWGYCTTPEEYDEQCYEGGHTLHGQNSTPWAMRQAARLAVEVLADGEVTRLPPERRFDLPARRYLPGRAGGSASATARRFVAAPTFHDPTLREDGFWEVRWQDVPPGDLDWHEPLVRVERWDPATGWEPAVRPGGSPIDDQRGEVAVVHMGRRRGVDRYAARWYDPVFGSARHRVLLLPNAGRSPTASAELT